MALFKKKEITLPKKCEYNFVGKLGNFKKSKIGKNALERAKTVYIPNRKNRKEVLDELNNSILDVAQGVYSHEVEDSSSEDSIYITPGKHLLSELQHINENLRQFYYNPKQSYYASEELLKIYKDILRNSSLLDKSTGDSKNACQLELIETQYLMSMAHYTMGYNNCTDSFFSRHSDVEKQLYTVFMIRDIDILFSKISQIQNLQLQSKENNYDNVADCLTKLDTFIEEFDKYMSIGGFDLSDAFDSLKFLETYRSTKQSVEETLSRLNSQIKEAAQREKKAEEDKQRAIERQKTDEQAAIQRKQQQEKDAQENAEKERLRQAALEEESLKYMNMSNEQIDSEILKLYNDLTGDGSRYVNILDFQKKVARAKHLLDDSNAFESDKLALVAINSTELYDYVQVANTLGLNYTILLDSNEINSPGKKHTFIVSKSDLKSVDDRISKIKVPFQNKSSSYYQLGTYTQDVITDIFNAFSNFDKDYFSKQQNKNNIELFDLYTSRNEFPERVRPYLKTVYEQMRDSDASTLRMEDVKCYISLPVQTNIIPILEKFKEKSVPYFFEAVPRTERNLNHRENFNLYFNRKDLDKFKNLVYPELSDIIHPGQHTVDIPIGAYPILTRKEFNMQSKFPDEVMKLVKKEKTEKEERN